MENELIYAVGETLLLELEGARDVRYPENTAIPQSFILITEEGEYKISLERIA
ncbi:MAG TPA: hypothetical protein PKY53_03055 [Clostridia bacterium]|jgi:hypothetical protein|nr:hypothetical protein [Clostridia bacterium]